MQCKGIHNSCEANLDVPYYTNRRIDENTWLSYKKRGEMCDLNVVTLGAEGETWGRLFQTEMVLYRYKRRLKWIGADRRLVQEGCIIRKSTWLRYKSIGWEIKISINNLIKCSYIASSIISYSQVWAMLIDPVIPGNRHPSSYDTFSRQTSGHFQDW